LFDIDLVQIGFGRHAQALTAAVIGMVMFGVALELRLADFARVLARPLPVLAGFAAQVLALPALTWAITMLVPMPPSVALGMLVVAACPGGNLSNLMTLYARGDVALSVTMTALSNVAAVLLMPLNALFWAGLNPHTALLLQRFEVSAATFLGPLAVTLAIPLALGMLLAARAPALAARLRKPAQAFSLAAMAGFIAWALLANARHLPQFAFEVLPLVALQNAMALAAGYAAARACRVAAAERRAITVEVGMQNSGIGLLVLLAYFPGLGGAALTAAGWAMWHLVSGLVLAWGWRLRDLRAQGA